MRKVDEVYRALLELQRENKDGITTYELSLHMDLDRANISRYLNILYKENKLEKRDGRPVKYYADLSKEDYSTDFEKSRTVEKIREISDDNSLDNMVGAKQSLQVPIQQAKAAIMYPPRGLHTIILGETGVGKSMFAELMYKFSKETKVLSEDSQFIRFNCADYADNPQLVISQIFGVKKGAYTGAESDKEGLLKKADGGIIFLDEIHRLSPQGQEMLFTYIDKGVFRPLGDTEKPIKSEAQIIAATTEDPNSYLLRTFIRRIPMAITLPSLKERSLGEKYCLLEKFIKAESHRLNEKIYFNKNALISFLLYDCPNNIGQLKSDIQLACAKAFLNYKSNKKDFIIVEQADLHNRVNKGLMKLQENRKEIEKILKDVGDTLIFSYEDDITVEISNVEDNNKGEYFYDIIESKLIKLKENGMDEKDINQIINIDIERYFNKYIRDLPEKFRKEEITKIVSNDVVECVEEILMIASERLDRCYDEKVYFGLALHLQGSIERIKQGNKIYHPKLNFVRIQYSDEFLTAMEVTKIIDKKFNIQVPLDEIGYLTMFLAAKSFEKYKNDEGKVKVLTIMHGNSSATSIVEVANTLIGGEYIYALDMPLSMKAEKMYELAKEKVREIDEGEGVLLLVDMGSLTNFGGMIKEETGINVKTVDMASTLTVIEAGRKAINGRDLVEIYKSCIDISTTGLKPEKVIKENKDNIIITSCFTGEGSAERLKEYILSNINNENIKVKSLNILDKSEFLRKIEYINRKYNILSIVGTVNFNLEDIPFISATDILAGDGIQQLENYIGREEDFQKISKSIDSQLKDIDGQILVKLVKKSILKIQERLDLIISHEVFLGIVIHICFLIEKILNGEKGKRFDKLNEYRNDHSKEFILVKQSLKILETNYNINIGEDDLANIVKMFLENVVIT